MKQSTMAGIDDYRRMLSEVADELSSEDAKSLAFILTTATAARNRISCGRELVQEMERIKFVSDDNVGDLLTILREKNFNVAADIVDKYKMSTEDSISSASESAQSRKRRHEDTEQEVKNNGKKLSLIKHLKLKYKELYLSVQPLPYVKDRMCCVDKVFIEGNIEYLPVHNRGEDTWYKMKSYHDIITTVQGESTRHVILGDPGYGKTTLILQFLYDWCQQIPESPLCNIDIVIFLRMRQLAGVTSIYRAIKELLLPKDSSHTVDDIEEVLQSTESTMIFFDGYDEYPDKSDVKSDFNEILKMKKLVDTHVIVTTRSADVRQTPDELKILSTRIRLAGFNETDQEGYILKAVVGGDDEAARLVREQIKENPVIDDMCQIPLFFTIFAHASFDKRIVIPKTKSITWVFRFILECLFEHTKNKNAGGLTDIKSNMAPIEFCKIAYEGLSKENQQIVWNKQFLVENVGENYYKTLICTGILTEEDVIDVASRADTVDFFQYQTTSSFYHKLFCEWYASRYLVKYIKGILRKNRTGAASKGPTSLAEEEVASVLSRLDRTDLQYLLRFASGLDTDVACTIINYIVKETDGRKLAVLCILEYAGNDEAIKDAVKIICSHGANIKDNEGKILQRANIRLIEIASRHNILVSHLYLQWSFSEVVKGEILLRSGLKLNRISCLEQISINGDGEKFSEKDVIGLVNYGMQSHRFQRIWFYYCDLPESFTCERIPASLKSSNVKVLRPTHARRLDFQSGMWNEISDMEDIGDLCTDEVVIHNSTSAAVQRSVITLLKKASSQGVTIFGVGLVHSFCRMDGDKIVLLSGLSLPMLKTLETMFIQTEHGRELDEDEVSHILSHLIQWEKLLLLDFRYCLLPSILSGPFLQSLKSKEVKVFWSPYGYGYKTFLLDLESGRWMLKKENNSMFPRMPTGTKLTEDDYDQEVIAFRRHWRDQNSNEEG